MTKLIAIFTLLFAPLLLVNVEVEQNDHGPKVLAVKFYADWCGSCKAMAPAWEALPEHFDDKPVQFILFDLTNEETKGEAIKLAKELNLLEIYEANQKTGFALIIDAKSKEITETLTRQDNLNEMISKISSYL